MRGINTSIKPLKDHAFLPFNITIDGIQIINRYLLLGVQSEPPANAVRTECCKELPPTLIFDLTKD